MGEYAPTRRLGERLSSHRSPPPNPHKIFDFAWTPTAAPQSFFVFFNYDAPYVQGTRLRFFYTTAYSGANTALHLRRRAVTYEEYAPTRRLGERLSSHHSPPPTPHKIFDFAWTPTAAPQSSFFISNCVRCAPAGFFHCASSLRRSLPSRREWGGVGRGPMRFDRFL